jgi:hypothetical protein
MRMPATGDLMSAKETAEILAPRSRPFNFGVYQEAPRDSYALRTHQPASF